jgi:DNA-binding MarR family transcriptional regulator
MRALVTDDRLWYNGSIEKRLGGKEMGAKATGAKTSVDQDRQLWTLLNQTHHAIWRARERELDETGLSAIQAAVLFFVSTVDEPVTPAVLSRLLHREPHTVSGLLTRMEKQGLVKRVKDLKRKNQVRIQLTSKGKKSYEQQSQTGVINEILSSLSQTERATLSAYLEELRNSALIELRARLPLPYSY